MAAREFNSWRDLTGVIMQMTEEELRQSINYEVAKRRRKSVIERLHMRYAKLHADRVRKELVAGTTWL